MSTPRALWRLLTVLVLPGLGALFSYFILGGRLRTRSTFAAAAAASRAAPLPSSPAALLAHHGARGAGGGARCVARLFRAGPGGHAAALAPGGVLDRWRARTRRAGFAALLNLPPRRSHGDASAAIAGCVVTLCLVGPSAGLLRDKAVRAHGAVFPAVGPPPVGPPWLFLGLALSSRLVYNNYGVHEARISATPTAFLWDWVGAPAMTLVGVATVNGACLVYTRGCREELDAADAAGDTAPFGAPVATFEQST